MDQAYDNMNLPRGTKAVFHASAPAGSQELAAFNALSRTDNVKGVNWLLADHHTEFGNKRIQTIYSSPMTMLDSLPSMETCSSN